MLPVLNYKVWFMLIPSSFLLVRLFNIFCISEKLILMEPHFLPSPIPVSEVHSHTTLPKTQDCSPFEYKVPAELGRATAYLFQSRISQVNKLEKAAVPQKGKPMGQKVIKAFKQKIYLYSYKPIASLLSHLLHCLFTFNSLCTICVIKLSEQGTVVIPGYYWK